jgi:hypothetical protein
MFQPCTFFKPEYTINEQSLKKKLNTIIQQYNNADISEANENERSIISAIVELIPNLYDCNMKTLSESTFSCKLCPPFYTRIVIVKTTL